MPDRALVLGWIAGHMKMIEKALAVFGKSIGELFLIAIYLFFILFYRDNYLHFLKLSSKTDQEFEVRKKRGKEEIGIINNFDYHIEVLSDHTMALILACARKIIQLDRIVTGTGTVPGDKREVFIEPVRLFF